MTTKEEKETLIENSTQEADHANLENKLYTGVASSIKMLEPDFCIETEFQNNSHIVRNSRIFIDFKISKHLDQL